MCAQIKRDRWNELCSSLDSRSSNNGFLAQNDEQAANILREPYQLISSLNFTDNDKYAKTVVSNVVHGCRSYPHEGSVFFSRAFSAQELDAAFEFTYLTWA
ncbi:hypothetical protein TNCV_4720641 [Trichonephila clavipes]|uniref:Uncharacterized protein n=1 Tax=Trichonephila clavipes TaxID=2585209 RepID=A0A8X7BEK8_TRICX|nr:hypothetical protein TNCV_4720641 [Trichonephila clavipes]